MKPNSIEIVVITDNPQAVGQLSGGGNDVRDFPYTYAAFSTKEITQFQKAMDAAQQWRGNVPLDLLWADKNKANNIVWINQNDISAFPSIKINAVYPDGSNKGFWLNTDVLDLKNYTVADIVSRLNALQKDKEAAQSSWLCELFPPLCSVGAYVWLGVVGFATYQAIRNKNTRVVWGAAALLAGNEFLQRGGLQSIQKS